MINLLVNCKDEGAGKLKILIVEDSLTIALKLKDMISENTLVHVSGIAPTVREALKMFSELKPDVVFLDINLPDGNGVDTLEHLKRLKPNLKVVVFSNAATPLYRKRFRELGSDYFLDKSMDFGKINEVVSEIVLLNGRASQQ